MEFSFSGGGYSKFARILDSKTSGTAAQTVPAFAGSWTTLELNTIDSNEDGVIASIASNQFTMRNTSGNAVFSLNFFKNEGASNYAPPNIRLYDVTAGAVYKSHIMAKTLGLTYLDNATSVLNKQMLAEFRLPFPANNVYRFEIAVQGSMNCGVAKSLASTAEVYKFLDIWST